MTSHKDSIFHAIEIDKDRVFSKYCMSLILTSLIVITNMVLAKYNHLVMHIILSDALIMLIRDGLIKSEIL